MGGRTFVVLNLAPVGCYPALLVELPHNSSDLDEYGCLISYNKAVADYNAMLKKQLKRARKVVPNASLVYLDTHSVLLQLFQHPYSHGMSITSLLASLFASVFITCLDSTFFLVSLSLVLESSI